MMSEFDVMKTLLTSSVVVSITTVVGNVIMFVLNRRATKEDRRDNNTEEITILKERVEQLECDRDYDRELFERTISDITAGLIDVKDGQKVILYDKILFLSRKFIKHNKISYEDKVNLNKMYGVYHNQLGGNGDLDSVIRDINDLPTEY